MKLIAQHGINSSKLMNSINLGGLPCPSIAITKDISPMTLFGPITLVGDVQKLCPPGSGTLIYSGDAYTKTYPALKTKINSKQAELVKKELAPYRKRFCSDGSDPLSTYISYPDRYVRGSISQIQEEFLRADEVLASFLSGEIKKVYRDKTDHEQSSLQVCEEVLTDEEKSQLKNGDYFTPREMSKDEGLLERYKRAYMKDKDEDLYRFLFKEKTGGGRVLADALRVYSRLTNEPEALYEQRETFELAREALTDSQKTDFSAFCRDLVSRFAEGEFIYDHKKDRIKGSHTLESAVSALKGRSQSEEDTMTHGDGKVLSSVYKEIKSKKGLMDHAVSLCSPEAFEVFRGELSSKTEVFRDRLTPLYKYNDPNRPFSFDSLDDAMRVLQKMIAGVSLESAMRTFDFDVEEMDSRFAKDGILEAFNSIKEHLSDVKTRYFEAKPQRAVSFDEFKFALVPETDRGSAELLSGKGVKVYSYDLFDERGPKSKQAVFELAMGETMPELDEAMGLVDRGEPSSKMKSEASL